VPEDRALATLGQHDTRQTLGTMSPVAWRAKIAPDAAEIVGERRDVTILFVSISNLTAASHTPDSAGVFIWIDEAMRLLLAAVHKYEGTVDKFTGDGLMALFGAPIAHEDDPERAVRAAIEMQAILQRVRERVKHQHDFDFQLRIGINTGPLVAGIFGDHVPMDYTVIGDTVNLASRLEAAAAPGTALVSFTTYQCTARHFIYQALPSLMLKGAPLPITAFRLVSPIARSGTARGLASRPIPMIGRAHDLALLHAALAEVCRQHRSQIAWITGEAGLGKSRLVAEFRSTMAEPDAAFYEGRCLAYARTIPLWVVTDLVRDILHFSDTAPVDVQRDTIRTHLQHLGLANDEVLPYLYHLLGLGQTDPQIEARMQLLDSSMLQRQTHAALRKVLLAQADLAPAVLILEDLHWVDPASRDFLDYLIQTTPDAPLMLVLTRRDSEPEPTIRPLMATIAKSHDRLVDIQLEVLPTEEAQLLIGQLLGQTSDESLPLQKRIAERAAGNPFYIEEIVRMLIDRGGLRSEAGDWRLTPQVHGLLHEVPATLKRLILARFDRLPESLRRLLQRAAVIGRVFPISLLETLDHTSSEPIVAELHALKDRQFLVAEAFGSEQGYGFRHALMQEAIYATLLKRDRQRLHEQIGQAIERGDFWPPDEQIEVLVFHYTEGPNPSKGLPLLLAAAQNAARRYANETAIEHYRRALNLICDLPDADRAVLFQIQIGLGRALKFVGQLAEACQVLEEALEHLASSAVESSSQVLLLVEVLLELADVRHREGALDLAIAHLQVGLNSLGPEGPRSHPALWRSLVDRLAFIRFRQGKLDEAFGLASEATRDMDPTHSDDPVRLASLYNTLGGVCWHQGKLPEAVSYVEHSLNLYKSRGDSFGVATALMNLGILYYARGMWSKAAESFEHSDRLRHEIGCMPGRALNMRNLGMLRVAMGDHNQARRDLELSLVIARRLGDDYEIVRAEIGLAHLAIIQSGFEAAAVHLETARRLLGAAGEDEIVLVQWLTALVQAEDEDLATARATAAEALRIARDSGLAEQEAETLRVLGTLYARAGAYEEAVALLGESIVLSRRRNDIYLLGLALLELGRVFLRLAGTGDTNGSTRRTRALEALNEAAGHFASLGAAYDLDLAEEALKQLHAELKDQSSLDLNCAESDLERFSGDTQDQAVGDSRPGSLPNQEI
jgi:predicted ATPase/class 3 adenylate cyclase